MLLSWCKELQGTKNSKFNADAGRIIHSVSHNFVENEGTERDILQYICQIKSFAANLTVEIMLGQFLVCGDSSLSRIMPMFSTFQQPRSRQSCLQASTQNLAIRTLTKV